MNEAPTSIGQWTTVLVMIIGAVGLQINSWRKDRREQEDRVKDLVLNTEIRDCLRQVEIGQTKQNGKLAEVVSVNQQHHEEIIRALINKL